MAPKDTGPFKHGQKVLVPHTDKFYEAKVMKSEKRDDGWYYLLHYAGWNKEWDEWVEAPGLQKFDAKLVGGGADGEGGAGGKRKASGAKRPGDKRRKVADTVHQEVELPGEAGDPAVELRLPAALKQVLLDEHEALAGGRRLGPLPRKPCVADILAKYVEERRAARQASDLEEQAANGLRAYFDKALPHFLLYDHELPECERALEEGVTPSCQYGGEHLLRLCAKLPFLVPIASAQAEDYATLQAQLAAFAAFLAAHRKEFFAPADKYQAPEQAAA